MYYKKNELIREYDDITLEIDYIMQNNTWTYYDLEEFY